MWFGRIIGDRGPAVNEEGEGANGGLIAFLVLLVLFCGACGAVFCPRCAPCQTRTTRSRVACRACLDPAPDLWDSAPAGAVDGRGRDVVQFSLM